MSSVEMAKRRLEAALERLEAAVDTRLAADSEPSEELLEAKRQLAETAEINRILTERYDQAVAKTAEIKTGLDGAIEIVKRATAEQ